jgi:hypothetical protein
MGGNEYDNRTIVLCQEKMPLFFQFIGSARQRNLSVSEIAQ